MYMYICVVSQAVLDAKAVGELLQTAGEDDEEITANCRAACNKHP